jgi:hypothetical protein
VSQEKEQKKERPTEVTRQKSEDPQGELKDNVENRVENQILPEISAYFADPKISPSAFLKILKSKKVKRFKKYDEERAQAALIADDSGERLWAIMSQASLPEAVERWIWPAASLSLKEVIGKDFDPQDTNPVQVLQSLRKALRPRLDSKDKKEKKAATNWLRIGICWLIRNRSIDLWLVTDVISSIFFEDAKKAKSEVKRAISRGTIKEFRLLLANGRFGNDIVASARAELTDEKRLSNSLRIELSDAEKRIRTLESDITTLRAELAQKEEDLKAVQKQFENERQHWGHHISETKAGQRVLLGKRVTPLLTDAVDALEIEPPGPSTALKRIKAVLKVIEESSS